MFVRFNRYIVVRLFLAVLFLSSTSAAQLDQTFGVGGKVVFSPFPGGATTRRVRIQPDGKIVTFGTTTIWYGSSFLSRHDSNGVLDPSFAGDGIVEFSDGFYNDMVVLSGGNILVTGESAYFAGSTGFRTYDSNGTRLLRPAEASWDDTLGRRLLVQPDGKIVIVTYTGTPNFAANDLAAIRYMDTAEYFDPSFGNFSLAVSSVPVRRDTEFWNDLYGADFLGDAAIQPDGKIVMMGSGTTGTKVVRLTTTGVLDGNFGSSGIASLPGSLAYAHPGGLVIQNDGKIVINGVLTEFGLNSSFIVRLNANGTLDEQFGTGGIVSILEPDPDARGIGTALAIDPTGKIITAGDRGGSFALMRFRPSGLLDTSFGTNGVLVTPMTTERSSIHSIAWQSAGKLIAVGTVEGTNRAVGIARYEITNSGITISGRVVTPNGTPIRNVSVTLVDSQGSRRTTNTGSFGLFVFDNVTAGSSYTVSASSKRFRFPARTIQPTGDLTLEDFVGLE